MYALETQCPGREISKSSGTEISLIVPETEVTPPNIETASEYIHHLLHTMCFHSCMSIYIVVVFSIIADFVKPTLLILYQVLN